MQDRITVIILDIFFSLFWFFCLFCIIKPGPIINFSVKFFKWQMQLFGFETEIKITPRAEMICRAWNIFMILYLSALILLIYSGKLR